jgi:hypothetical protein
MAGPQHRTPEYRAAYKKLKRDQAAGKWLWCVQGMHGSSGSCLHPTRDIAPDQPAHVAHDDSGNVVIGVAHARCNVTDGGQRRHESTPTRWIL